MTVLEIYLEILTNFFEILYPPLLYADVISLFATSKCQEIQIED